MPSLASVSSAAVSSLDGAASPPAPPETYSVVAYDAFALGSGMVPRIRYTAYDTLHLTTLTSAELIYLIREHIDFADLPSAALEILDQLSETVHFGTALGFAARVLVSDGLTLTDNSDYAVLRILVASEALRLSTGVGTTLEVAGSLYETLAFIESIDFIRSMEASEVIAFADELSIALHARLHAADALAFADALGRGFTVIATVSETLDFDVQGTFTLSALLSASEYIAFAGNVPLGDGDYEMWVVNTATIGAAKYTNTPFNSMATTRGKTYGLTETGLFELTGDDDAGAPIEAAIQTGMLDFGTHENKAIARAYLYVGSGDHIYLRAISSRKGERASQWYEIIPRIEDDVEPRRVRLARGVKSVTWGFEVKNIDGGSLDLRYLDAVPVVLRRRR